MCANLNFISVKYILIYLKPVGNIPVCENVETERAWLHFSEKKKVNFVILSQCFAPVTDVLLKAAAVC